ncbi:MAG: SMI1/KNR4 family protein, partial [Hyphomicrobiales bacterium]
MHFSENEEALMRKSGIAVFEGKIIIDARPPISEEQIAQLEKRIAAPLPADLLALWRTCYGGTVDYDGEADFDGHIAHLDFKELFYP